MSKDRTKPVQAGVDTRAQLVSARPREYGVAFFTEGVAEGYLRVVKVTLSEDVMDMSDKVNVALADDPLYLHVQAYVKGNPR